jgi:hypothetical protein
MGLFSLPLLRRWSSFASSAASRSVEVEAEDKSRCAAMDEPGRGSSDGEGEQGKDEISAETKGEHVESTQDSRRDEEPTEEGEDEAA